MRLLAGLVTVLTACYHPNPQVGALCGSGGACPNGQLCDFSQDPPVCVVQLGPSVDAPPPQGDAAIDAASSGGPCVADAGCAGGVCIESSSTCVDDGHVIFLDPAGSDTGACPRAAPCKTFDYAFTLVSPTLNVIRVGDGSYSGTPHLTQTNPPFGQVVISGEDRDPAGATLTNTAVSPAFTFDTGTDVLVEGITITSGGNGIFTKQSLAVSRVHVLNCGTEGLNMIGPTAGGGQLRVVDSVIEGSIIRGVLSNYASVDIERTYVIGNQGGGIRTQNGAVQVHNTMVVKNGTTTSTFGGARIDTVPPGGVDIAHVTFAYNQVSSTSGFAPGIASASMFSVSNLILADNGLSGNAQLSATITATNTLFEGGPMPAGAGNKLGAPAFVNVNGGDFHILATSLAVDAAAVSNVTDDIDGDTRPYGAAPDMGADEYHP